MSTLRVNTLQDATGSNQPAMVGAAKAWVNFNGTGTVAIRAAFNVSSITDNGSGDYTVNFTNAMVDTNYTATISVRDSGGWIGIISSGTFGSVFTTTSIRVEAYSPSTANTDNDYIGVVIFR